MQARCGDPGQGGAVSVGPIWHACIAIRDAKHRYSVLPNAQCEVFSVFIAQALVLTAIIVKMSSTTWMIPMLLD